jgi:hypothetical protein
MLERINFPVYGTEEVPDKKKKHIRLKIKTKRKLTTRAQCMDQCNCNNRTFQVY